MKNLSSNKKTIFFVSPFINGFIKNDLNILSEKYNIIPNIYKWEMVKKTPLYLIHQFFFLCFKIKNIDKIFIEFGGYWSLLPSLFGKIFNKPTIIVCHGTDCASIPSLNYGIFRKKYLKTFCKYSYKLADLICPVSESLISVGNTFLKKSEKNQGILTFVPDLKTPFKVIHNGLDIDFWKTDNYTKIPNTFLAVFSKNQFYLKGGDLIIEMAMLFEDCSFEIVGMEEPNYIKEIPKNLKFSGKLNKEDLKKKYTNTEYYFQLSSFEGFGLSLCEAMLNGCIPIGSSSNIIPEIIGKSGYILSEKDASELENIIKKAISNSNNKELSHQAKSSIENRFNLKLRRDKLMSIVNDF